ncbi:hypothetical protein FA13DRAFT_1397637 [Coprinellus micaceus]|uniref:Uncharacterized protein n=1 Tax=Coprinellus micaceus TaxID=71717 RepID=A0A4Y7SPM5_COPMI|nr:hypothetical protein FA13DRAFT_1397637 [Coprinellus micaceus]
MDPTLWTSFLNANLHEYQFLRVVARSGDLPVGVWFKSPRAANSREGVKTSDNSSERTLKAIRDNLPRIRRLAIDLSRARIESNRDANLQMLRLLTSSIPNLHTLSLAGSSGQFLDLTPTATSAPIFGGEAARIQHLELMDFIVPPRAFAHTIVSLSIGFNAVAKLMEVLPPWIEHIQQSDIPGLRDLAICGPTSKENTNRYVYPWDNEIPPVKIPSTIERVKIVGSMPACLYICRKLRDSVGPRSNAIQRRLAERPSKRGPTNPGNHQTVVSSVGERTSNGCQRRFDGDVGFGCSRNAPPTALERRSRWNAGIKVCDIGGLISIPTTVNFEIRATFHSADTRLYVQLLTGYLSRQWGGATSSETSLTVSPGMASFTLSGTRSATITYVPSSPGAYEPMVCMVLRNMNPCYQRLDPTYLLDDTVSEETCFTLHLEISEADLQAKSGNSSCSDIPSAISHLLQSFRGVRTLRIKRYDLEGSRTTKSKGWFEDLRLLESRRKGKEREYPLPGPQCVQLSQAQGGNTGELPMSCLRVCKTVSFCERAYLQMRSQSFGHADDCESYQWSQRCDVGIRVREQQVATGSYARVDPHGPRPTRAVIAYQRAAAVLREPRDRLPMSIGHDSGVL